MAGRIVQGAAFAAAAVVALSVSACDRLGIGSDSDASGASGGGGDTGIPECDAFLKQYDCYVKTLPAESRAQTQAAIDQMRKGFKSAATSPAGRATVLDSCVKTQQSMMPVFTQAGCASGGGTPVVLPGAGGPGPGAAGQPGLGAQPGLGGPGAATPAVPSPAATPSGPCVPCATQEAFDDAQKKKKTCCPGRACEGDAECGSRVCCKIPTGQVCTDGARCSARDRVKAPAAGGGGGGACAGCQGLCCVDVKSSSLYCCQLPGCKMCPNVYEPCKSDADCKGKKCQQIGGGLRTCD